MKRRFIKRDADGNVLIDKICEPLEAVAYRLRRTYASLRYVGKLGDLTVGAAYYVLPDGRISKRPLMEPGALVEMIGVALNSTTLVMCSSQMAACGENGHLDVRHLVEAP